MPINFENLKLVFALKVCRGNSIYFVILVNLSPHSRPKSSTMGISLGESFSAHFGAFMGLVGACEMPKNRGLTTLETDGKIQKGKKNDIVHRCV